MKTRYTAALTLAIGFGLGAVAVQALHALAKPKAYVITEIEVLNQEAQNAYLPKNWRSSHKIDPAGHIWPEEEESPHSKGTHRSVQPSLSTTASNRPRLRAIQRAWKALAADRAKAIKATSFLIEGL